MTPLVGNSRNNKAIMIESRSEVAKVSMAWGEGTANEHKEMYWLMEMFRITVVVITQLHSFLKIHEILHLKLVSSLVVNCIIVYKLYLNQSDFKNATLSAGHRLLWATGVNVH